MAQWVLSVAGIAILCVLADVILPDGQTRKYIKTVIGIVVTLVLVLPVINLFHNSVDFSAENKDVMPQQQYLQYVQNRNAEQSLRLAFSKVGLAPTLQFDPVARCYTATFTQAYSPQLQQTAQQAVAMANVDYPVTLLWAS